MNVAHMEKQNPLSTLPLNLHSLSPFGIKRQQQTSGSDGGTEAVVSGVEERGVITNCEVSSSDSELSGWPSIDRRGSKAVWVYRAGAVTEGVVATIGAVTVTWA
jgi:hypothetical protein